MIDGKDMDEMNSEDIELLSNSISNSDESTKSTMHSNLDIKMRAMQGYTFKHNKNFNAMKKVIVDQTASKASQYSKNQNNQLNLKI